MELKKHRRCIENEATPVSDSSSVSNDDGSAFDLPNNPSLSLDAKVSGNSGDAHMLSCD